MEMHTLYKVMTRFGFMQMVNGLVEALFKVLKGIQVTLELKDPLVQLEQQAHKDHKVKQEQLVLQEVVEQVELLALKEQQEIQEPQVLQVLVVRQVPLEQKVIQEVQVQQVLKDQVDHLEPQVLMEL
jgi:hypothetical protein